MICGNRCLWYISSFLLEKCAFVFCVWKFNEDDRAGIIALDFANYEVSFDGKVVQKNVK